MKARTHDIAAATSLLAVIVVLPELPTITLATAVIAILANQIGGIIPDIDQPTAPFWRNLPIGGVIGKIIGKMLGGHRFLTHSLLGLVLVGLLSRLLLNFLQPLLPSMQVTYVWWALMIGMLSHLIMDTITKEGVPWLLPIPVKFGFPPIKQLRVTTGKWTETLIVIPVLLIIASVLVSTHYAQLLSFLHNHIIY
ncbi:MAG TPA: metal-dependent hydrolase [Candidatus Chromulinivoraceae bacterium]|nr:metal-dependent hydrolase [Candidatus Chromulinivoraceae bacterium]